MDGTNLEMASHHFACDGNCGAGLCCQSRKDALETKVDAYLTCCEGRDFTGARRFLSSSAVLIFPGGREYSSLESMVQDARGLYRWVRKKRESNLLVSGKRGESIVISTGTLYGEKLSGEAFSGIRYQDWFTFDEGLIVKQEVWNDLAVSGVFR